MSLVETLRNVQTIRQRLMNPPNAVPDLGIDLKRKPAVPKFKTDDAAADQAFGPKVVIDQDDKAFGPIVCDLKEAMPQFPLSSLRYIQRTICRQYGITLNDMLSDRRTKELVGPRQIAMYVSKTLTLRSLPYLGRHFNRDHTSVLHGIRTIKAKMAENENFAAEISDVMALFPSIGAV